jgi:hypothetical protein
MHLNERGHQFGCAELLLTEIGSETEDCPLQLVFEDVRGEHDSLPAIPILSSAFKYSVCMSGITQPSIKPATPNLGPSFSSPPHPESDLTLLN